MLANMDRLLAQLPPQTLMYPGHEYTVSNLQVRLVGSAAPSVWR